MRENRNAVSVIRLITRLIFVWFVREKGLAPAELFDERALRPLLRWSDPKGSTYYKAILQSLFFATLNTEMGEDRRFRGKNPAGRDSHYGISTVYRYENYFADPAAALRLFASVPFLNGGLFECLDRPSQKVRVDGFSDRANNTSDYGRKLYLIENCIYGVDIQPIAVQIAKLRFFISLVVDQRVDDSRPNRGIRPLPNLETKFVAANTLIGIGRPQQLALRDPAIEQTERELAQVRKRHFAARTPATKEKYRSADQRLRGELAALLRRDGWDNRTAAQLAAWDPYDQNAHADFFDPEWMFGLTEGFDVVIGNPPYVQLQRVPEISKQLAEHGYRTYAKSSDIYCLFYEKSLGLAKSHGFVVFITSNSWLRTQYGQSLRRFLVEYGNPQLLIDFEDAQIFASAIVEACVLLVQKAAWQRRLKAVTVRDTAGDRVSLQDYVAHHHVVLDTLHETSWSIGDSSMVDLKRKMETDSTWQRRQEIWPRVWWGISDQCPQRIKEKGNSQGGCSKRISSSV